MIKNADPQTQDHNKRADLRTHVDPHDSSPSFAVYGPVSP